MFNELLSQGDRAVSPAVGIVMAVGLVIVVSGSITAVAFSYSDDPHEHYEEFEEILDSAEDYEDDILRLTVYEGEMLVRGFSSWGHFDVDYDFNAGQASGGEVEDVDTVILEVPEEDNEKLAIDYGGMFADYVVEKNGEVVGVASYQYQEPREDDPYFHSNLELYERVVLELDEDITIGGDDDIRIYNDDGSAAFVGPDCTCSGTGEIETIFKGNENVSVSDEFEYHPD